MLSRARGFSLIELMVVIVIVGILAAVGLPTFREYVNNSKVRAVATEIREGVQLARMEAIRRNASVTFCMTTANGTGWDVREGSNCNGAVIRTKAAMTSEAVAVTLSPANGFTVVFDSGGRRTSALAGTTPVTAKIASMDVSWKTGSSCGSDCIQMRVEVSSGGMIRTCNRNLTAGDPQACL